MASIKKNEPQKIALAEINNDLSLLGELITARSHLKDGSDITIVISKNAEKDGPAYSKRINIPASYAELVIKVIDKYGADTAKGAASKADKFDIEFDKAENEKLSAFSKEKNS